MDHHCDRVSSDRIIAHGSRFVKPFDKKQQMVYNIAVGFFRREGGEHYGFHYCDTHIDDSRRDNILHLQMARQKVSWQTNGAGGTPRRSFLVGSHNGPSLR